MILTLLATIGGAIAAAGTTVATGAAAVGGTIAAGAAAAGSAVAAGAAPVGSTVATVGAAKVAGGVIAGGIALAAAHASGYQSGKTEGTKIGYAEASKVYEAKFQSLLSQLNKANSTIAEQRQYIARLRDLNTDMRSALEYYRAQGKNVSVMELTSYNAANLLKRYAA